MYNWDLYGLSRKEDLQGFMVAEDAQARQSAHQDIQMRILVVEDDRGVRGTLVHGLGKEGYEIDACETGAEGIELARHGTYNVIILDIGLPDLTGLEVAAALRAEANPTPILFLTARDSEEEIVQGLEIGADGYMTKPFSLPELVARIRAIERRRQMEQDRRLVFQDLELDPTNRQVTRGGNRIRLTEVEFKLLAAILEGGGEIRSRDELLKEVWRITFDPETGILDVHMSNLRKKLNRFGPPLLETVRGKGYRLVSS
jgi:DNA-binding response OmpR family regulator